MQSSTWARTRSGSWSARASPRTASPPPPAGSGGRARRRRGAQRRDLGAEAGRDASSACAPSSTEARAAGAALIDVVVASPGRQARNADQLVRSISRAAGVARRVLSREEEARLAFEGALEAHVRPTGAVAVCDVGGGSAQIAVGTVDDGAAWLRSVDLGSLRLSARVPYGDPPTRDEQAALRAEAARDRSARDPAAARPALAVGGTARAAAEARRPDARRGRARRGDADSCAGHRPREIDRALRHRPWRARALPAGAAILAEIQSLLAVPLEVGKGGLREGVVLALLDGCRPFRPAAGRSRAGRPAVDRRAPRSSPSSPRRSEPTSSAITSPCVDSAGTPSSGCDQVERVVGGRSLRQLVALLEVEAEALRSRLERLDATQVRARDQPGRAQAAQRLDERLRLLAALLVERPQRVVADPCARSPARAWRTSTTFTRGSRPATRARGVALVGEQFGRLLPPGASAPSSISVVGSSSPPTGRISQ